MSSSTGRRQKELDEAVEAIGSNVSGVQGDVAQLADLDRLYETISMVKGRIDIVFANVRQHCFDLALNSNGADQLTVLQRAFSITTTAKLILQERHQFRTTSATVYFWRVSADAFPLRIIRHEAFRSWLYIAR